MITHHVVREDGRILVDRATLAALVGRSVNTIRARCPIDRHGIDDAGRLRAMYDLDQCEALLGSIRLWPAARRGVAA
jgi:hypothetical protein